MQKKEIKEWAKTIIYPIVIAALVLQVIRPVVVKEHSMYPTIDENDYVIVNKIAYKIGEPKCRDIVVFQSELKLENGESKYLIKRVIGVPGDVIKIEQGKVIRNNIELVEPYLGDIFTTGTEKEYEIPEGKVFLLGDNRTNSIDSRDERVGLIDIDEILGRVEIRLYPFNNIGLL